MKVYKTKKGIIIDHKNGFFLSKESDWDTFINRQKLFQAIKLEIKGLKSDRNLESEIKEPLAPVGKQEVWGSGVTYIRSRQARMEESKVAGSGDFYARVYEADRPELFFKATASRTVGSGDLVRIRKDSKWNVPEPELTLFICSAGSIEGYTIGNDMSSRDIEGENPLYLPQAKSYDASASLGPCIYVPKEPIKPGTSIQMEIISNGAVIFVGEVSISRMKRTHKELVNYLFRETSFSSGAFLMTGTGIVPPEYFTLKSGDEIRITIEEIGTLVNTVA